MLPEAMRRLLAPCLAAGAVLASAGAAVAASPAPSPSPSTIGSLGISPETGNTQTAITLLTSKPCPNGSTNVIVRVFGKGFPADGQIVLGNTVIPALNAGAGGTYGVPLTYTLDYYANLQPKRPVLSGPYQFVLSCGSAFDQSAGNQVGTLTVAASGSYTVAADSRPAPGAAAQATSGAQAHLPPAAVPSGSAAASAAGTGSAGVSAAAGGGSAAASAGAAPAAGGSGGGSAAPLNGAAKAESTSKEPGVPAVAYVAAGVTLVVVVIGVGWGLSRRERQHAAAGRSA